MSLSDRTARIVATNQRSGPAVACCFLVLVAIGYLSFIRLNTATYAAASDASGYLNLARLLSQGELTPPSSTIDGLAPPNWHYIAHQPLGFATDPERGRIIPTYPVGLPLHLWFASMFVELNYAAMVVNVFIAAATGVLMLGLARKVGLPWAWAVAGVAIMWACPLYLFMVLQPMSDVLAMVWCMIAMWCAFSARDRWPWAFAAGAAVAVAVLVRPSNALLLLPVAGALGFRGRAWAACIAGGLPGAVFLTWYNLHLYGKILTTGYGDVSSSFSVAYFPHNTAHVFHWVFQLLTPLMAFALAGLPWALRQAPVTLRLLPVWVAVFFAFYLCYYHTGETWWYLRFLLPAFPALILLGLHGARALSQRLPSGSVRVALSLIALGFVLFYQIRLGSELNATKVKRDDALYLKLANWMTAHAPPNAIVLQMQTSGAFRYYTHFTLVRWDLCDHAAQERLFAVAQTAGRPVYATLFEFEEKEAFAGRLVGEWRPLTRIQHAGVWQLISPPAEIP